MAFVVNRTMNLDVESLTGAAYGERSDESDVYIYLRRGWFQHRRARLLFELPVAAGAHSAGSRRRPL
jgi:hypothetical protein